MRLTANIAPMGAVRMTGRGKWTSPTAKRYLQWKESLGYMLMAQRPQQTDYAVAVKARFYIRIPDSWSKKKREEAEGKPVTVKPDIDNLVKGLFDAANGIVWKDDNQVVRCEAEKLYSMNPRIEFEVTEVF
ncbi:RusA family crossover junction endodeoxyribonuclease [Gorillibacterium sp. sgz5001074]|uniref:RusA family crossover junction endodeoxyribonuclease n=1 Tax=Gorillibacterium sp. sgz5001074 TaxID=3446695 RepID=UPI003F67B1DF